MNFINIKSGSKGNASILYTDEVTILIDFGMGKRELSSTLSLINKHIDDIDYILITHNHIDHIQGARFIDENKIYSLKDTYEEKNKNNNLSYYQKLNLKDIEVTILKTYHDAPSPCGFIFKDLKTNETMGYITDCGYLNQKNIELLKNLNYYYFESNYDEYYLVSSRRTDLLKSRIISTHGHLSNGLSAFYLSEIVGDNTKDILLCHLSEECNSESAALANLIKTFDEVGIEYKTINIRCCRQKEVTFLKEVI